MLRVTGGKFRGQMLASPRNKPGKPEIRPTTSIVRESLFSILQCDLPGARFLDLFAGSGLMGIEALSRGASFALSIEQSRAHTQLIQQNYDKLGLSTEEAKVVMMDVFRFAGRKNRQEAFDIIFADPPYGLPGLAQLVVALEENEWLKPGGYLIIENDSKEMVLENFIRRQFGNTTLYILKSDTSSL
ncbi:MAG: 16S rRNA (guanine(966)-N(2))-methyltransferase RsmD [Vampirovibrionales bacterium]|nr:16S rRNA (guanine(966)-N(2))-methyltransferase RsmD [Vampirovibrionales bacterium]